MPHPVIKDSMNVPKKNEKLAEIHALNWSGEEITQLTEEVSAFTWIFLSGGYANEMIKTCVVMMPAMGLNLATVLVRLTSRKRFILRFCYLPLSRR
jgi:hypothetical protein